MTSAPVPKWFSTTYDMFTHRRLTYYSMGEFVTEAPVAPEDDAPELIKLLLSRIKGPVKWRPCDVGLVDPAGDPGDGAAAKTSFLRSAATSLRRAVMPSLRLATVAEKLKPDGWLRTGRGTFFESRVLPWLGKLCVDPTTVEVPEEHQEIMRYVEGGFMDTHTDRVRGPNHVGTLLLVVPSPDLEGGQLLMQDGPGAEEAPVGKPGRPFVVFIPLHTPHRVTPVVKGERYVAKASVFGTATAAAVPYSPRVFED
jgi:hypothetical protein